MKKARKRPSPKSETELLEMISLQLPKPSFDVLTAIGDDCAVIRPSFSKGSLELLKTDALVEGVHFAKGTPWSKVGWKALCRPISDIAAMGGAPLHALITVASSPLWRSSEWSALYRGIGKAAREFGVSVVGGETVRSPGPLFLSVTLTGNVPKKNLKLRSGATPGDLICVTGKLGGSFKSGRHLTFQPRVAEGRWLGGEHGVTAMMDISDGLGSDLPKLAKESDCSFRIAPDGLPLNQGCSFHQGVSDGEDYELLLTVAAKSWPSLQRRWNIASPEVPLTPIGVVLPPGEKSSLLPIGFDHMNPIAS
jgi:thiamine-monophosphate kinase